MNGKMMLDGNFYTHPLKNKNKWISKTNKKTGTDFSLSFSSILIVFNENL